MLLAHSFHLIASFLIEKHYIISLFFYIIWLFTAHCIIRTQCKIIAYSPMSTLFFFSLSYTCVLLLLTLSHITTILRTLIWELLNNLMLFLLSVLLHSITLCSLLCYITSFICYIAWHNILIYTARLEYHRVYVAMRLYCNHLVIIMVVRLVED